MISLKAVSKPRTYDRPLCRLGWAEISSWYCTVEVVKFGMIQKKKLCLDRVFGLLRDRATPVLYKKNLTSTKINFIIKQIYKKIF